MICYRSKRDDVQFIDTMDTAYMYEALLWIMGESEWSGLKLGCTARKHGGTFCTREAKIIIVPYINASFFPHERKCLHINKLC